MVRDRERGRDRRTDSAPLGVQSVTAIGRLSRESRPGRGAGLTGTGREATSASVPGRSPARGWETAGTSVRTCGAEILRTWSGSYRR